MLTYLLIYLFTCVSEKVKKFLHNLLMQCPTRILSHLKNGDTQLSGKEREQQIRNLLSNDNSGTYYFSIIEHGRPNRLRIHSKCPILSHLNNSDTQTETP